MLEENARTTSGADGEVAAISRYEGRRPRSIVVVAVARAVAASAAFVVAVQSASSGSPKIAISGSMSADSARDAASASPAMLTPQLVVHTTSGIDGERSKESWVDPASGASREMVIDATGRVLREQGWDASTGESWVVDPIARTVWRQQSKPSIADTSASRDATYRAYEDKLAGGGAIDEGRETYAGADAQRIRIPNSGGEVTVWLDTAKRRVVGVLMVAAGGGAMRLTNEYLEGTAAAQASLLMPDVNGYTRIASIPQPSAP